MKKEEYYNRKTPNEIKEKRESKSPQELLNEYFKNFDFEAFKKQSKERKDRQ